MVILKETAVYAVLEYHNKTKHGAHDEHLHGVYTTREIADKVANKRRLKGDSGYVCVLKQKINGPRNTMMSIRVVG